MNRSGGCQRCEAAVSICREWITAARGRKEREAKEPPTCTSSWIKAGYAGPELKAEMDDLQARKSAFLAELAAADEPAPRLHPSMADLYRNRIEELAAPLQRADTRLEASEMLRGLIDSIVVMPEKGQPPSRAGDDSRSGEPRLRVGRRGNLAAMLTAAQQMKRSPETGDLLVPFQLVAGARNKLYRQLCWTAA